MKHTVSTMKTISGGTDSDRVIAAEFCADAIKAAQTRLNRIKFTADLAAVLDSAQLAVATDARAGIRHLHAAMESVCEFHHQGSLSQQLDAALLKIGKVQEEAEALHRWLHMLYTRD